MPYLMQMRENGVVAQGWELSKQPMTFGRGEDVDVCLDDQAMSRTHFVIEFVDDVHQVRDLGSSNGLLVNGGKVKATPLTAGDLIKAGGTTFRYDIGMATMINQAENLSGRSIKNELKDIYKQFE